MKIRILQMYIISKWEKHFLNPRAFINLNRVDLICYFLSLNQLIFLLWDIIVYLLEDAYNLFSCARPQHFNKMESILGCHFYFFLLDYLCVLQQNLDLETVYAIWMEHLCSLQPCSTAWLISMQSFLRLLFISTNKNFSGHIFSPSRFDCI